MFIFSIVSLPVVFVLIVNKIDRRILLHIFSGIVLSSILSLLMWSLSTFYKSDSDDLFSFVMSTFLSSAIPIFLLFLIYAFLSFSDNLDKKRSLAFNFGFIYWNLLFSLVLDPRILSSPKLFIQPIFAIILLYIVYSVDFITFKTKDLIIKGLIYFILPFYYLLVPVLTSIYPLEAILALFIPIVFILIVKINIGGVRTRIFIDSRV